MSDFTTGDYWKGIILYGLNAATYKMALARCLLKFSKAGQNDIAWQQLAECFHDEYFERLNNNAMPQQTNPGRLTKLERIVKEETSGRISRSEAIERVGVEAFNDVVPRFHTIGTDSVMARDHFYEAQFGKKLILKDGLFRLGEDEFDELTDEIEARWSLLEGAFSINHSQQNYQLANDIRDIYLQDGYRRTPLTPNIPFLKGYQGGDICFYCGEVLGKNIEVDHLLPRQIIHHDEVWNLVLSHGHCNRQKLDMLVGPHFVTKLIARNENIMGSNHPWKHKIIRQLGRTPRARADSVREHYENVKLARGATFWGGTAGYNPETDPFYRRLVTALNNK